MRPAFAADARKSHSAKRGSQITQEPAIHPGDTHIHLLRHAMPAFQIVGPDRRRQSVLRVIGHGDSFFFRVKRRDVAHGPKDFLLHATRRFRQPGIDGWLYIEAMVATVAKCRNSSSGYNRCPFFYRKPIVAEYLLPMLGRDQRP